MTTLDTAPEGSTYEIVLSFLDKASAAMTPTAASWSLFDAEGNVINSRTNIAIAVPSTTNTIELSGADLPYKPTESSIYLVAKIVYDSSLGTGRITYAQFEIPIEPIKGAIW